ncbi:ubiquitin-conjugating enzyme E2 U-like [Heptranchias perlo]|uniref:ubiquitin-conjugating enzyme E2 U-like n=1 Tax=Heptranchias perlo TaxID=212740 RepID=UPI003559D4C6
MQSKAYLLLEREYIQLQEARLFGISVSPVREDLLEWVATIQGLKDSLWEGAFLQLSLKYTEDYNSVPPTVTFNTIPFHPNVDTITGKPCIDFLDNPRKWEGSFSLTTVLLTIQVMLSNPVLENAVNVEAIEMLREKPSRYRKMVLECVRASRQLKETGIKFAVKGFPTAQFQDQASVIPYGKALRIKRIGFDEYHKTWTEIATSKATENCKNPMLEAAVSNPNLQALYYGLGNEELQKEIEEQNKEFNDVMYGPFGKQRKTRMTIDEKLARINLMKKSYILDRSSEASTSVILDLPRNKKKRPNTSTQEEELWDKEVDSLVDWTNALNLDELEDN